MYLALYRKYRPKVFRDVISQEHITTTLQNQIKSGQFAHAYLFTGTRGTGKTTCAKILAKAVNCLHPTDDGNPCGECEACKRIEQGSTDIIEIDAASNNGVEDVRILRDEIVYTPIDCKYKVYIIDEVHMLSINAFNALLKTIEEPPSHVIFILATTDVHKIPATILSRCQRYQFRKIDSADCVKLLLEVAGKENVTLEKPAAELIARLSEGAMRDAYSLLDQCISVSTNVTEGVVRESCGVAGTEHIFEICEAVLHKNSASALRIVNDLLENSKDMGKLVEELIQHYRNLMLLKITPKNPLVIATADESAAYERFCKDYSLEMIMRCLDLLTDSLDKINRMKQTGQARLLTEMLMIQLCTPKLDSDTKALSLRLDALEQRVNSGNITIKTQAVENIPEAVQKPVENNIFDDKTVENKIEAPPAPEDFYPEPPPEEYAPPADFALNEPPVSSAPPVESKGVPEIEKPAAAAVPTAKTDEVKASAERVLPKPAYHGALGVSDVPVAEISDSERFSGWNEVLDALPPTMSGFLSASAAYLHNDVLIISVPALARSILSDAERADKLRAAVYSVMGKEMPVLMSAEEKTAENTRTRLDSFLDFAKENGIEVKTVGGKK